MKQFLVGGFAFLGGVILTFWLMSEPEFQQAEDLAFPPQLEIRRTTAPETSLNGGQQNQAVDTSSIADRPEQDSNIEAAFDPNSVGGEIPVADVDAVPLLPGIELSGTVQLLHGMLEQEAREELWAVPMEQELYNYFFENSPELADNFGVPNVVCRTSICEVQAIGYGQGSLDAWLAATSGLDSQPWALEFIQVELGGNRIGPDAGGLVLVLVRASGDATVQSIGEPVATI